MAMHTLLQGDVAGYFREQADTPGTLWLFQHIPKTAGSSFRSELARQLRPQANVALRGMAGQVFPAVQDAVNYFLAQLPQQRYRFASGHLNRTQVASIEAAHPRVRLITMLRDPVERVISDYRYQRTPKHAGQQKFLQQFPDFPSYIESRASQNRMYVHLRRSPKSTAEEVMADLREHYAFVGLTESYALSRRLLMALMGVQATEPEEQRNRTEANADNHIADLDALRPRIRELNALDEAIYHAFAPRLLALQDAITAYLDTAAPPLRPQLREPRREPDAG